jgi:hypothetical protein
MGNDDKFRCKINGVPSVPVVALTEWYLALAMSSLNEQL